ncbi:MAG TPA: hypothetical protein DCP90_05615 [Clostridiales bacterium]|nr:MAG: hypothetical protein A2Y22_05060 [Clostridiales bacterium GWD2_32_59]HAN10079.1 hypothetical protein [Clostridiales bacterium]
MDDNQIDENNRLTELYMTYYTLNKKYNRELDSLSKMIQEQEETQNLIEKLMTKDENDNILERWMRKLEIKYQKHNLHKLREYFREERNLMVQSYVGGTEIYCELDSKEKKVVEEFITEQVAFNVVNCDMFSITRTTLKEYGQITSGNILDETRKKVEKINYMNEGREFDVKEDRSLEDIEQ